MVDKKNLPVLVLSRSMKDIGAACGTLKEAGIPGRGCVDLDELSVLVRMDAGALLIFLEALGGLNPVERLTGILADQPVWSSLPVIVLTRREIIDTAELELLRELEHLSFVTFLERPCGRAMFVSTIRSALEARWRQYDVRRLMNEAERNIRLREEFLAMLGHELRNPLANFQAAVDLLDSSSGDIDKVRKVHSILQRQTAHLTRIVDDLLDVTRVMRGKLQVVKETLDLRIVAGQAVSFMEHRAGDKGVALDLSLPDEPAWIEGDDARLSQILTNLLDNALRHTGGGGKVSVAIRRKGDEIELRVKDTGSGMTPEQIGRIFELFFQDGSSSAENGGLGIGLTVTHRLVELHGGSVETRSEGPGRGSEFIVTLPAGEPPVKEPVEPGKDAAYAKGQKPSGLRVLLVDDNVDFAEQLEELLSDEGCEVMTVHSGASALETARAFLPGVVLLDIGLPDIHGAEVASRLASEPGLRDTRLVALTGFGRNVPGKESIEDRFHHVLVKPVKINELLGLLDSMSTPEEN